MDSKRGWYAEAGTRRMVANNPLHGNALGTRADLQDAVRDLFAPLRPWFSEGKARVQINASAAHYFSNSAELEGFARPLWGIVPLVAGGGRFDDLDLYLEGFTSGSDPEHPEYWGVPGPYDQRMVEMAVFGLALMMAPDRFWAPLTARAKTNLSAWLHTINDNPTADNNWRFFRVLVNLGLKNVGAKYSKADLDTDFARLETFYRGDGWYIDGCWHQLDYYIPFAIHFYGLIVAELAGDHYPEVAARYRERSEIFANDFQYWFGADGAAVAFGRSMTYRFAQGAFWSAMPFAGIESLPMGRVKGLLLRHLRWWSEQPIAERDGVLSVGYAYPNLLMSEQYNAPGSPYWAMKTFLALATPEDHPFWQTEEEAPEDLPQGPVVQAQAGFIARRANGEATLLNAGQDGREHRQADAKYARFAYSSVFPFSVASDAAPRGRAERTAFDSTLAVSLDGKGWRSRAAITESGIEDGLAYGVWAPFAGTCIESWLDFAGPGWHIRVHRITSDKVLLLQETGFAIDRTGDGNDRNEVVYDEARGRALAASPFGTSCIRDLSGNRAGRVVRTWPNTSMRFPRSAIPQLDGEAEAGTEVLVTGVFAAEGTDVPPGTPHISEGIRRLFERLGVSEPNL